MAIEKRIRISCSHYPTEFHVLYKIMKELDPNFIDRGYSIAEMLLILRVELGKSNLHVIVELYNVHPYIQKIGSAWLYYLIQLSNELSLSEGGNISLVLTHCY